MTSAAVSDPIKQTEANSKFGNLPGPGPGRPKGSNNRYTLLKEQLIEAIEKLAKDGDVEGGVTGWLAGVAKTDKIAFVKIVASLIPRDLNVNAKVERVNITMVPDEDCKDE